MEEKELYRIWAKEFAHFDDDHKVFCKAYNLTFEELNAIISKCEPNYSKNPYDN